MNPADSTPTPDTLVLAGGCTYGMTTARGGAANALPVITIPIGMIGPATVTNASLSAPSRIAEVGPIGRLTLTTGVAFTRGSVLGHGGGGTLNRGAVTLTGSTLTGSTLTGNTASGDGGGLANADTPSGTAPAATFTNSPVSGNTTLLGDGGGIHNGLRGTPTVTGVTGSPLFITGDRAGRGVRPRSRPARPPPSPDGGGRATSRARSGPNPHPPVPHPHPTALLPNDDILVTVGYSPTTP